MSKKRQFMLKWCPKKPNYAEIDAKILTTDENMSDIVKI